MNSPQIKPVDLIDTLITQELLNLPLQLNTKATLYKDLPEKEARFNDALLEIANGLFKANGFRRSYKTEEKNAWKTFKKEGQKTKTGDGNLTKDIPELQNYILGFFSEIQPTLNSLASLINLLINSDFKSWGKQKDEEGVMRSGKDIATYIETKSPEDKKQFSDELSKFINSNTKWLGYLCSVVEQKNEAGQLSMISPLVFDQKHRTVIPQLFTHNDGFQEPVLNFMNRAMQELILFIINTIIFSMQIGSKDFYLIKAKDKAGHLHYQWVPTNLVNQTENLPTQTAPK